MPTFAELMEQFKNPGENGLPETFADELQAAYTEDLSIRDAAVTAREQAITEHQNQIAAKEAEVLRLKAVNYDLMKSAPKAGEPDDNKKPDAETENLGVDSLFE